MSHACGFESITVKVTGDPDESYGDLLGQAILKAEERLGEGVAVHRHETDCGGVGGFGAGEEWYLGCGHASVPEVGTMLEGVFTFIRHV